MKNNIIGSLVLFFTACSAFSQSKPSANKQKQCYSQMHKFYYKDFLLNTDHTFMIRKVAPKGATVLAEGRWRQKGDTLHLEYDKPIAVPVNSTIQDISLFTTYIIRGEYLHALETGNKKIRRVKWETYRRMDCSLAK